MAKFGVWVTREQYADLEVEADNEEEAREAARAKVTSDETIEWEASEHYGFRLTAVVNEDKED